MEKEHRSAPFSNLAAIITGGAVATLGLIVLVGWYTHNVMIVQVLPTFVPMQYNTALGFLLCGIGFIAIAFARPCLTMACGGLTTAIGLLTLVEYTFQVNLGIDQLFMQHYITVKTSHPGRMGPNTALSLMLSGVTLLMMSIPLRLRSRDLILGILGSVIINIGLDALLGYLIGVESAYGWADFTQMAIHTAIGFVLLGLGIIVLAWRDTMAQQRGTPRWAPVLVGVGFGTLAVFLWQSLSAQEQIHTEQAIVSELSNLKNEISQEMDSQILAMLRMAERWEDRKLTKSEWESLAKFILQNHPGIQAISWVDPSYHVRWIAPLKGNEPALNLDLRFESRRRAAMEAALARRDITLTRSIELVQGGKGFLVSTPILSGDYFGGFIHGVFRMQQLLDTTIPEHFTDRYAIAVFDGDEEIYSRYPSRRLEEEWGREAQLDLYGVTWRLKIWPQEEILAQLRSPLPKVAFGLGGLMALLLAWTVHLAQTARFRTLEFEVANQELAKEITERNRVERDLRVLNETLEQRVTERTRELEASRTGALNMMKEAQEARRQAEQSNEDLRGEIAERKKAEEELRESEDRYHTLAKVSPVGIFRTDAQGNCIYVNERWCEITGLIPDEALGAMWAQGLHPDDRERVFAEWSQACKEGLQFRSEYRFQRPDGITTWVLGQAVAEKGNNGEIIGYVGTITDISERKLAEEVFQRYTAELMEWKNRYEAAILASGQILYDWDPHTHYVTYGGNVEKILGYSIEEIRGHVDRWLELVHPEDRNLFNEEIKRILSTKDSAHLEYRIRRKNGDYIIVEDTGHFIFDSAGEIVRMVGFVVDITKRKNTEETLARLASFPELNPEPIVEVDLNGHVHYFNPKTARAIPDVGERGFQHPFLAGLQSVAAELQKGAKGSLVREVKVGNVWYEQVIHYVHEDKRIRIYARDVSDRKLAVEALEEQAIRDSLTHLYNRRYFNYRIGEEIARADRNQHTLAILLCDLDHFKAINDTRGHQVGDEMLKAAAKGIQESTRGTDLVFRWGGDEIVAVLSDANREGIMIVAERIRKGIHKVSEMAGMALDLSIGVALCPEHGRSADELIRLADRALYIAKRGGDKIHIGEEEYHLDEHTIKVVFQPVVNVRLSQVIGYEALSRDPQGRLSILELFKRYQAIGQLNELKCLCFRSQMKAAQEVGLQRVFINVDFNVLSQLELVPKPPGVEVILEISELEALHDVESHLEIAWRWRAGGYKFAIDDFGAGFISLPFIARLVPDYIKVDRSTILQAVGSEKFRKFSRDLVRAIRNYSKEGIIAEGIETKKELQVVKNMGIFIVQGFLLGKPQELK